MIAQALLHLILTWILGLHLDDLVPTRTYG